MISYDDRGFPIFPQKINLYIKEENVRKIEILLKSGEILAADIIMNAIYLGKFNVAKVCLDHGFKLSETFLEEEIGNIEFSYDLPLTMDLPEIKKFLNENFVPENISLKLISAINNRKTAISVPEEAENTAKNNFDFLNSDILPDFSASRDSLKEQNLSVGRVRKILVETDRITRSQWVPNLKIYQNDRNSDTLESTFSHIDTFSSQLNLLKQNIKRTEIFQKISETQKKEYKNVLEKLENSLNSLYQSCDEIAALKEMTIKFKNI